MNKILIADDDKTICLLYEEEFFEDGYDVDVTSDPSKIMVKIEWDTPDLIVLDIKMGDYDGLDILQDIRNAYYDLPVILCSGYPAFKSDLKSIAADYYVVKSSRMTELKTKVKMALDATHIQPDSKEGKNGKQFHNSFPARQRQPSSVCER